jgi:hypothetical protein
MTTAVDRQGSVVFLLRLRGTERHDRSPRGAHP